MSTGSAIVPPVAVLRSVRFPDAATVEDFRAESGGPEIVRWLLRERIANDFSNRWLVSRLGRFPRRRFAQVATAASR